MYRFRHRYVRGYHAPLKRGKYVATIDTYEVDRAPNVGETCSNYLQHVKQSGKFIETRRESFEVE